jgi:hypothetical protein
MMEFAEEVLKANRTSQFDNLLLRIELLEMREQVVIHILVCDRNSICVLKRYFLPLRESLAILVVPEL